MKWGRFLLSMLTAAVFLWLVLWISGVSLKEIVNLTFQCDRVLLLLGLGAYATAYLFRALRYKVLLQQEAPPVPALFCVVSLHNLFNNILPARTGELSYIYHLRKRFQVATAAGLATLVVARVLDVLCIMLFLAVGLIYFSTRIHLSTPSLLLTCLAVFVVAFAVLLNLSWIARQCLGLFRGIMTGIGLDQRAFIQKVEAKGDEAVEAFQSIRSRNLLIGAFLMSLGVWFCIFLTCYAVLLSFPGVDSVDYPFGVSIVGTTALNAVSILPINAFGNLGTWEAAWAAGYMFVGMDKELAVQTGGASHIAIFAYALVLGFFGWLGMRFFRR